MDITADYIGGAPGLTKKIKEGRLVAAEGGLTFEETTFANMLAATKVHVRMPPEELRAISLGRADKFRGALGGIVPVGEDFSVAVGGIFQGKAAIVVATEKDGQRLHLAFATQKESDADRLVLALQGQRAMAGLRPIPKLEDEGTVAAADEQTQLLRDIKGLLEEQIELIKGLKG